MGSLERAIDEPLDVSRNVPNTDHVQCPKNFLVGDQLDFAHKARLDMEKMFGGKVYLEVWVKVKSGWSENRQTLSQLGYGS